MRTFASISCAALIVCAATLPSLACAQWVWKDDQGHMVMSDQPPPKDVPESRIVRSPSGRSLTPAPATPAPAAADGDNKPKTLAEQDADFKKRQKDAAEAAKKQSDEEQKKAAIAKACQQQRDNLAALQSGQRMATYDSSGNRSIMDDSARNAEMARQQSEIAANCH